MKLIEQAKGYTSEYRTRVASLWSEWDFVSVLGLGYSEVEKAQLLQEVAELEIVQIPFGFNGQLEDGYQFNLTPEWSKLKKIKDILKELEEAPEKAQQEIESWEVINKSPYSKSVYNTREVGWGYKGTKSLRISDHWNFFSRGDFHCKIDKKSLEKLGLKLEDIKNKWMKCQWLSSKKCYKIIEIY